MPNHMLANHTLVSLTCPSCESQAVTTVITLPVARLRRPEPVLCPTCGNGFDMQKLQDLVAAMTVIASCPYTRGSNSWGSILDSWRAEWC